MIYFCQAAVYSEELYESADIDIADSVKSFPYHPAVAEAHFLYVLTLVIFEGYHMFGESYYTGKHSRDLGLTIARYIYMEAFRKNDMGFGSAIITC